MLLSQLLKDISIRGDDEFLDVEISGISQNSKNVKPNDLFICIPGYRVDGHDFSKEAEKNGAIAIISERKIAANVTNIIVDNVNSILAKIAFRFYEYPQNKLKLIGITGTNGKTTITYMIKSVLESFGRKTGIIGTNQYLILNESFKATNTTPNSLELAKLLHKMVISEVEYVIMEVSSHALSLGRTDECEFLVGAFTNLTQDHLDFHENMEDYLGAKKKLFDKCKIGIINLDDVSSKSIIKDCKCKTLTYGVDSKCGHRALNIFLDTNSCTFILEHEKEKFPVKINVPGNFTVYNALAAISVCHAIGFDLPSICKLMLKFPGVKGRIETVKTGRDFHVIIDYAHSPDGLINILKTVRGFTKGKIITLFGCGGDRDKKKRPQMGKIAAYYSDFCIITSDNPRTEDPMSIIKDILPGAKELSADYVIIENRREAIKYAIDFAKKDDVIILAGKGHETYQILKDKVIEFDERKIVFELLEDKNLA